VGYFLYVAVAPVGQLDAPQWQIVHVFPSATTQQSKNANAPASASAVAAPTPAVSANGAPVSANNPAVAPVKSEIITITTDVMKADIDTLGGEVRRLELLKYKEDAKHEHFYTPFLEAVGLKEKTENHKNVVLFDAGEKRIYLAQTGLINGAFLTINLCLLRNQANVRWMQTAAFNWCWSQNRMV
jgi:YidC/Oxa1 family membrane protein insertase